MKKGKDDNLNLSAQESNNGGNNLPGYPTYPESDDIYNNYLEERDINPEDISKTKESDENYKGVKRNEKDFNDDFSGSDLDIPGSELDENQIINVGNEDEENNYYSLGGDNHEDLEENQGE